MGRMLTSPADRVGQVLKDTYRLTGVLGEGGFGAVFEAEHVKLPRRFAVKVLHSHLTRDRNLMRRFETDAAIAASIQHEHVVEAYDYGFAPDGAPYIVLELLEGEELGARLEARGRLTVEETVSIAEQVASALAVVHAQGYVHRDVKPENIFLANVRGRRDHVKLLDFGIARVLAISRITDGILGTLYYLAPEQVTPPYDATPLSDVFSLGAVVYECLTGERAFGGTTAEELLYHVIFGEPPSPSTICAEVPAEVDAVVMKALAKSREHRFHGAVAFAEALREACSPRRPVARLVLRCEHGLAPGAVYTITTRRALFGRPDPRLGTPDIDLSSQEQREPGRTVSRRHAEVLLGTQGFQVVDVGSTAGTFVNDRQLEAGKPYPLSKGDRLLLGKVALVVDEAVGE